VNKKTLRDLPDSLLCAKRVLVRLDLNVPVDESGKVSDDTRIRASLPTLKYILDRGGRPTVLSHFGRP
jgi:phosphoglycerate kinase